MAEAGLTVSVAGPHRFFARRGMTRKKDWGHLEQDRPDALRQRHDWFENQVDLEPERLMLIDETWTATNMARLVLLTSRRFFDPPEGQGSNASARIHLVIIRQAIDGAAAPCGPASGSVNFMAMFDKQSWLNRDYN